ncbi:DUF2938 domain-containing protein [Brucella intermedia]|uniref:DUF2938 domain-containing protein n=2 Tax=Brucella intermedia TaxID=94625 RepID=A0ABR6ARB9_9HYPH|nr:DUF2938 domain-containing protein [Brucella intermedia]ERI14810.1 hypothetical protein O206_03715 [Ochrobactrum sp. EGD-AQ16]KAB2696098.1 DUF2938 domain-containing protein [Brucella intermedia]KAB2713621.1 DUF2938 domain-containing protein [Brucella intermedia]MBA8852014.1 hypothetical protein [Brucella intermedia]MCO7735180.1 DUF2938 domain-containing protein [Brucella intermedia]
MLVLHIVFIGVGATLITDIWTMARARVFGVASLDYGLVGRWFGHMLEGRFVHERITASPPVRGEKLLGWGVHYAIGVLFAAGLVAAGGLEWMASPKLLPALAFGLLTVAAPFLVMQPGMGAGIAARKTPKPWAARGWSIVTHLWFGAGLYLAALAATLIF